MVVIGILVIIAICILVMIIGVLLTIAFIFSIINCSTEIKATVSDIIKKSSYYRGRTVYELTPVFTYVVNGKEYSAKADAPTSDPHKFAIGQSVSIFIDKNHPEKIRYGSNIGFLLTGLAMLFIGMLGAAFMIFVYLL